MKRENVPAMKGEERLLRHDGSRASVQDNDWPLLHASSVNNPWVFNSVKCLLSVWSVYQYRFNVHCSRADNADERGSAQEVIPFEVDCCGGAAAECLKLKRHSSAALQPATSNPEGARRSMIVENEAVVMATTAERMPSAAHAPRQWETRSQWNPYNLLRPTTPT